MERTEEWICSHVVIGIFTKDFESELNKYIYDNVKKPKEKAAVQLPFGGRNVVHNEAAYSGECLVGRIRVKKIVYCIKIVFNINNIFLGYMFGTNRTRRSSGRQANK